MFLLLRVNARAIISNLYPGLVFLSGSHNLNPASTGHGINGIGQNIDQNLLQCLCMCKHQRQRLMKRAKTLDIILLESRFQKGNCSF